jgi:hypothetical protein
MPCLWKPPDCRRQRRGVLKPDGKFFGLDDAARTMTANMDGHVCAQCGERVTELREEGYRIRTAAGWVGKVEP